MKYLTTPTRLTAMLVITFGSLITPETLGKEPPVMPDLTKDQSVLKNADRDWNLGAIGARGWIYGEKITTHKARQIGITKVYSGSPADGILQIGDVILGVQKKLFSNDPRTEFGRALTFAEAAAGKGQLSVKVWRDGKTMDVTLQIPVLGTYSSTAPYQCKKSKRILEQGCEALATKIANTERRGHPKVRALNALALLASGNEKYLPVIKKEAEWAAKFEAEKLLCWSYSYLTIFLSEYIMATGDQSVMPGLSRLALAISEGQSDVGSWGHRFAKPDGILRGYGMMHATGVPLTIGLILAKEAGVHDPKIDLAIERSSQMIRFYSNKGTLPYGDHEPWLKTHDNNGKNGMASVMFNLLDEPEPTKYFAQMSVASHGSERDCGHTGNFPNMTWAIPSINPLGPNATGAWMKEFGSWYLDLARQHDGQFLNQGPPAPLRDKFRNWDMSGSYLLAYAMPLKKLRITGKGKQALPPATVAEADSLIMDGKGWDNLDRYRHYDALTTQQLLNKLESWSPIIRERASMALGRRNAKVVPYLADLLMDPDTDMQTRYGACQALKVIQVDRNTAVKPLIHNLESNDLWLRVLSARALADIGAPAKNAIPKMLKRATNGATPQDPRGMEQRFMLGALFDAKHGILAESIEEVDRKLLHMAIRAGLTNQNGWARGTVVSAYKQLTLEEIRPLLPVILYAVNDAAPSGVMFASSIRNESLSILAKHHVEEGLAAGVTYLKNNWNQWGSVARVKSILESLVAYGANAKPISPQLEAVAKEMAIKDSEKPLNAPNRRDRLVREAIKKIEASKDKHRMIQIKNP